MRRRWKSSEKVCVRWGRLSEGDERRNRDRVDRCLRKRREDQRSLFLRKLCSMPYVLLNYNNKFKDAFYDRSRTGTFDELLLYERKTAVYLRRTFYLHRRSGVHRQRVSADARPLKDCDDRQEKLYLLTIYIEEFRGTIFRQTMFCGIRVSSSRSRRKRRGHDSRPSL